MNVYRILADAIVVFHFAYVAFVVIGMIAILVGILRRWAWVRNFWFRAIHLAAIGVVVLETLFGVLCPLTEWEDSLREASGAPNEAGTFVGRWAHALLFVDTPPSVLSVCYVIFGVAVVAAFVVAPPRWPWRRGK
jgi:hypothetical protein